MCESKIVGITSAAGWYATYREDDGSLFYRPLAAWALKRDGSVVGLDPDEQVEDCEAVHNFIGYRAPGEPALGRQDGQGKRQIRHVAIHGEALSAS